MCFAAWTKGTIALLLDIRALAETLGETGSLLAEWEGSMPELKDRSLLAAQQALTKGWRWRAEMEEIARTFRDAELPDGFHQAASEIYGALSRNEEAASAPSMLAGLRRLNSTIPGPQAYDQGGLWTKSVLGG
jgi:hypothetical protein